MLLSFESIPENPWLAKRAHSLEDSSTLPPCGIPTHCPLPIQKSILWTGKQLIKEKKQPILRLGKPLMKGFQINCPHKALKHNKSKSYLLNKIMVHFVKEFIMGCL